MAAGDCSETKNSMVCVKILLNWRCTFTLTNYNRLAM